MKLPRLAPVLATILALAPFASAQCPVLDNLDIPGVACGGTQSNVPQRGFQQSAVGICWLDCGVDTINQYTAVWGALNPYMVTNPLPPQASCGWYRARLRIYQGAGLQWDGMMHFTYSRTWIETPVAGQVIQVWRYLVNGDLRRVSPNPTPCAVPACVPAFNQLARFTGYVDYAYDCGTTLTERAWMITHACDAIDHAPGYPRAGVFHPNRYYTYVGPDAGFVIGAGSALEAGGTALECVRKIDALALPARCNTEEPLLFANISPSAFTCMCGTGPANWYEANLFVGGAFGTSVSTFAGADPFRSFAVGMWTNPAVYPGVEELRWNSNEASYIDCTGVGRQEYYFGVTTSGGYQAYSFNAGTPPSPLPLTFVDQCNSVTLPANVATRNIRYRSDHILNLNL